MSNLILKLCYYSASVMVGLVAGQSVLADTIVLNANQDTAIYEDNTSNSNGSGDFLFAGKNGGDSSRRSLVRFDLAPLPAGAEIESVTITMFMSQSGAGATDVSFHRLLSAWGESTSDAPGGEGGGTAAAIGDATWEHTFFDDQFWASSGGDFLTTASATTSVAGVGSYSWSSASLLADVQSWIDGDSANFGWAIVGDESASSTSKRFNSRSNIANAPILTIEFSTVPEPGAFGVVLAIGFVISVRRQRPSKTRVLRDAAL